MSLTLVEIPPNPLREIGIQCLTDGVCLCVGCDDKTRSGCGKCNRCLGDKAKVTHCEKACPNESINLPSYEEMWGE